MTTFDDRVAEVRAKKQAQAEAFRHFQSLCLQANRLLSEAARFATANKLPDVDTKRAEAGAALSGAMFHHIVGEPDPQDFQSLRDDLELVRDKIDPLLEAIGEEAASNCPYVKQGDFDDCFKSIIRNAIDGNAAWLLDKCAEETAEALSEPDHAREREVVDLREFT